MIALSSFKPFSKCSPEIWQNQLAAKASWERVFYTILYFNEPEPLLSSSKTGFAITKPGQSKPKIRDMALLASELDEWSCIINADIVVAPKLFHVEQKLRRDGAYCATSKRWQIPDDEVVDGGLDFFLARPETWAVVADRIPKEFELGKVVWDSWLLNFFICEFQFSCYDITQCKAIFHPKHEERTDQNLFVQPGNPYLVYHGRAQQCLVM